MNGPGTSERIAAAIEEALARRVARRAAIGGAVAFGIAVPGVARARGRQATPVGTPGPVAPPVAEQRPETRFFSGVSVTDPYAWLEDPNDPEVIAYLEAENAYTEAVMAPTQALQETL